MRDEFWRSVAIVAVMVFVMLLVTMCPQARAQAPCYPGVPATPQHPHVAHPKDTPYLAVRPWGVGSYWYCMDPATGKWAAWYSIGVLADAASALKDGETLDSVIRAIKVQFDEAKTAAEKRAVIEAAIQRLRAPWQSCSHAIANNIQPQAAYCIDIRDTACGKDTPAGERCRAMPPDQPPATSPTPGQLVVASTTICAPEDRDAAGKCVRRQTYVWANGQRGAVAQEKVEIGSQCDQSVGAAGFHGVLGRADRVAPCVRR